MTTRHNEIDHVYIRILVNVSILVMCPGACALFECVACMNGKGVQADYIHACNLETPLLFISD